MLVLGEVRTALLRTAAAVPGATAARLVDLLPGEPVRRSERPQPYVLSPEVIQGVDCALPTDSGARVGGVGTVSSRAVITGGRLVQATSTVRLARAGSSQRLPWSHYLARPGLVETAGRTRWQDVAAGFLTAARTTGLDLGAVAERLLDAVQAAPPPALDGRPPFRSRRTRLRWAAWTAVDEPWVTDRAPAAFVVEDDLSRTLWVSAPGATVPELCDLGEELALHDWLLTSLLRQVDRSGFEVATEAAAVARIRPAMAHLGHLWMPCARVPTGLQWVWAGIEARSGLSRQWDAAVSRIRDQVALSNVALLSAIAEGSRSVRDYGRPRSQQDDTGRPEDPDHAGPGNADVRVDLDPGQRRRRRGPDDHGLRQWGDPRGPVPQ